MGHHISGVGRHRGTPLGLSSTPPQAPGTHRHLAGHGRGSVCSVGCRGGSRRPGAAEQDGQDRICPHPPCEGRGRSSGGCRGGQPTSMHRQGTRNSYGSEMWWPPGTSTCNMEGATAGRDCVPQSGMGVSVGRAITCWWKGRGSSSHSRASWWHSRTMRGGPAGTHTSMARTSGTQAWVKTGPAEQAGRQLVPASSRDTSQPLQSHQVARR